MTIPQPNPLELAKQGNVSAIAFLINRSLKPKGINAKVAFRGGFLQIVLESAQVPEQATLPLLIHKGIISLGISSIKRLKIYGKQIDEEHPRWSEEFNFSGQDTASIDKSLESPNSSRVNAIENLKMQSVSIPQVTASEKLTSVSETRLQSKKNEIKNETSASKTANTQKGCLGCLGVSFLLIAGLSIFGLLVGDQSTPTSPSPLVQSTSSPKSSTVYYLAVTSEEPVPNDLVPVSDQETIQLLIAATQIQDREKYNSIANSSSVALIPGGSIIDIIGTSEDLVQIKLYGRDASGNDLSGQVRWTHSKFIQNKQIQF